MIPARWGSTRLPGKSLVDLDGKPMIQRVYERVCAAKVLDDVYVATDDERIVHVIESVGGKAVMTRADHPSGTDRVAEAARGLDASVIINIQGDEPLIDPDLIDELAGRMQRETHWDMGTAATPFLPGEEVENPAMVKVVFGGQHQALYFSRSVIPYWREATDTVCYWRHLGLYAYRRDFLEKLVVEPPCVSEMAERLEQLRALHIGGRMLVVETASAGVGVDTAEDVDRVLALLRKQ